MVWLTYLVIFCFGLIIGSFLNVVIYRYNTGRSVATGRSQCATCGGALRWFELLPLFSFLLQGGRCRQCLSRISWQYPIVEALTATLLVLIVCKFGWSVDNLPLIILHFALFSLLVVISVYDLRHQIIPDGLVYAFISLALLSSLWPFEQATFLNHLGAGVLLSLFFATLWWISGGRWMGFGDAKLALGVGFLLGLEGGGSAIAFAFWLGAIFGLGLILSGWLWPRLKSFTIKSEVPFAPFIVLGLWLNFFFNLNVASFF